MQLQVIHNKIYQIRNQKVMLDFDLAELYQTETKYLKRAVKTNLKRFPEDFMFELTKEEFLRCNLSTSKRGGTRYLPFAFTEHGITMLAAVLNSEKAVEMNIAIVRAFVALRQLSLEQKEFMNQLEKFREELHHRINVHDEQLNQIYETLENMLDEQIDKKSKELEWKTEKELGLKNN